MMILLAKDHASERKESKINKGDFQFFEVDPLKKKTVIFVKTKWCVRAILI